MAQEAGAESAALVRPLDDAGNVGHDERFMVADLHDAQIGFERGEEMCIRDRIVCVNRRVHRHRSNIITEEQLRNYDCPIQLVSHGHIPHTVLEHHPGDCCCDHE